MMPETCRVLWHNQFRLLLSLVGYLKINLLQPLTVAVQLIVEVIWQFHLQEIVKYARLLPLLDLGFGARPVEVSILLTRDVNQ